VIGAIIYQNYAGWICKDQENRDEKRCRKDAEEDFQEYQRRESLIRQESGEDG
jgi:hypothetical protein